MNLITYITIFIVVILIPLSSAISMLRMRKSLASGHSFDCTTNNIAGVITLWLTAIAVVSVWLYQGGSYAELGLVAADGLAGVLSTVIIIAALITVMIYKRKIKESARCRDGFIGSMDYLIALLPKTRRELYTFFLLSVSAGVCEEIIYRGFIFAYLLHYMDLSFVVIISSLLFGLAHSYQGLQGIPLTGSIGLMLGLLYVYTGSLWAPMILHVAIDMGYGYLSWLALQQNDIRPRTKQDS